MEPTEINPQILIRPEIPGEFRALFERGAIREAAISSLNLLGCAVSAALWEEEHLFFGDILDVLTVLADINAGALGACERFQAALLIEGGEARSEALGGVLDDLRRQFRGKAS